jgi:hypothetical protein
VKSRFLCLCVVAGLLGSQAASAQRAPVALASVTGAPFSRRQNPALFTVPADYQRHEAGVRAAQNP